MKIRMKTLAIGPTTHLLPGVEYDVSKKQGEELVAGGYAERIEAGVAVKPSAEKKTEKVEETTKDEKKDGDPEKKPE